MVQVVVSPEWFYGESNIIDIVSVVVLFLIALFSLRYYLLDKKKKNYIYLSVAFFTICSSLIFKIVKNIIIYKRVIEFKQFGIFNITYESIYSSQPFFIVGFLLYRILILIGLYMLYCVYIKPKKQDILIAVYFIIVSTYFGQSAYYIFHLTAFILLLAITLHFIKEYMKRKYHSMGVVGSSFGMIMLSQGIFAFVKFNPFLYVLAEIVQLAGYILLLNVLVMVFRNAKKKDKK